jgi:outer membrane immunogenic protein
MQTRTILSAIAAAALLAAPLSARAADMLPPRYQAPVYAPAAYAGWTGFYLGLNAGYGFGTADWDFPALNTDTDGALAGGTAGYSVQSGSWVWGLEGDFDWADVKASTACAFGTCQTQMDWFATARGRVGYAGWGSLMPFVTAGGAFGDVKVSNTTFPDVSKTMVGWTAGGGLEYGFGGHWSAKVEYLYSDLGKLTCGASCGGVPPTDISVTTNTVRGGINYRF